MEVDTDENLVLDTTEHGNAMVEDSDTGQSAESPDDSDTQNGQPSSQSSNTTANNDERTGVHSIPAEIFMIIVDQLSVLDLLPMICVTYKTLRRHNIVPRMSTVEFGRMRSAVDGSSGSRATVVRAHPPQSTPLQELPAEIRLMIGNHLSTFDRINFAIAAWPLYYTRG